MLECIVYVSVAIEAGEESTMRGIDGMPHPERNDIPQKLAFIALPYIGKRLLRRSEDPASRSDRGEDRKCKASAREFTYLHPFAHFRMTAAAGFPQMVNPLSFNGSGE